MTPAQLSRTVLHAVRRSFESGRLCAVPGGAELPERPVIESPPRRGDGDYGVSVAFQVAKAAGMSPYDVARVLRSELEGQDGVRSVEVAGAGFLNVTLDDPARAALVAELADPDDAESDHQPYDHRPYDHEPRCDEPASDIARWSAATGDAPASLAVRTTQSSPLFHVQYAYARTRALSRNAHDLGFRSDPYAGNGAGTTGGSPYGTRARALLALLADHRRISEQGDSGRQARHLVAVGDAFFDFHDDCSPLPSGDEKPGAAHRARLALVEATGAVLAGGLSQLGVTAPAHL
ncbi:DALR anticodon-binding domain-containing protein [Streptomyces albidus (ex Kaewkla and Franco 2022)]|uniref:DALR anticodon-binding domain-containing protein n=1 Tax=Streptomyces albidus (ex Kaewkla and Franco 2022) TaxID=722709 RepID=UPI0015EFA124|nr:DALR anticodon-binding domain-containing protein [Streptomyces albidus (ex Kaewkla and Franco 2022)]